MVLNKIFVKLLALVVVRKRAYSKRGKIIKKD